MPNACPALALLTPLGERVPEFLKPELAFGGSTPSGKPMPRDSKLFAVAKARQLFAKRDWPSLIAMGPRSLSILLEAVHAPSVSLRRRVIWVLGEIGDPRAVPVIQETLSDPISSVREATVQALGKIGSPAAIAPLDRYLAEEGIRPYLHGRRFAVQALGKIGGPACLNILVRTLLGDADSRVRREAALALSAFPSPEAVQALRQARDGEAVPGVTSASAQSLGKLLEGA